MSRSVWIMLCCQLCAISLALADSQDTGATPGALEATMPLGCVTLDAVTPEHTPADVMPGAIRCIESGEYDRSVSLYQMVLGYGLYDIERVSDVSAHAAVSKLMDYFFEPMSNEQKATWFKTYDRHVLPGGPEKVTFCKTFQSLGPPTYHPHYMIKFGLDAMQPWSDPSIKPDFDSRSVWIDTVVKMECADADQLAEKARLDAAAEQHKQQNLNNIVTQGLAFGSSMKINVSEYYFSLNALPENNDVLGLETPHQIAGLPFRGTVGNGGQITIEYMEPIELFQNTVQLTPILEDGQGIVRWTCSSDNFDPQYLPGECETMAPESAPLPPFSSKMNCTLKGQWTAYNDDQVRPFTLTSEWVKSDTLYEIQGRFSDVDGDTDIEGLCMDNFCSWTQTYTEGDAAGTTYDMLLTLEMKTEQNQTEVGINGTWSQNDETLGDIEGSGPCIQ